VETTWLISEEEVGYLENLEQELGIRFCYIGVGLLSVGLLLKHERRQCVNYWLVAKNMSLSLGRQIAAAMTRLER
jgi:hypothetical protein